MKSLISSICKEVLSEELLSYSQISGLGSVNEVFSLDTHKGTYILRLNNFDEKYIEYRKEKYCLDALEKSGVPGPRVLAMGRKEEHVFMLQNRLEGRNGKTADQHKRKNIWKKLGVYARIFQEISKIEDELVNQAEFHADWKARLSYNLKELSPKDSLIVLGYFDISEHQVIRSSLESLVDRDFKTALVHGDLCPRNVQLDGESVYLLDWGTAEINVVPHTEIGIILLSGEASEEEFPLFLEGMGISPQDYQEMESDIHALNLLHRLDKFRWAETYDHENLKEYVERIQTVLKTIHPT